MIALSRVRRVTRWGGLVALVAGAVIMLVWAASGWYGVAFSPTGKGAIVINRGCLDVEWASPGDADYAAMSFDRCEFFPTLRSGWKNDALWLPPATAGHRVVYFPLWWVGAPLVPVGAFLARLGREAPVGHCPTCRYNLSGLPPGASCPECGNRPSDKASIPT